MFSLWAAVPLPFLCVSSLLGQDDFEIQVYEYETVPKQMWNLETHMNYELTRGITDYFELAGYPVTARTPGLSGPIEYAGARIRPRIRLPESWNLPMKTSSRARFWRGILESSSSI